MNKRTIDQKEYEQEREENIGKKYKYDNPKLVDNHQKPRIIKDCIYGHILIPFLCSSFMDVPEFQRLRRVRQLGMAHYTYPSAVHTRFEHSLGVMHLAGKMVDQLRKFVEISNRTKELIQLAGMYHDIGHFAFSHLFDATLKIFSQNETNSKIPEIFKIVNHEERSVFFLSQVNSRLQLLNLNEEKFVIDLIRGHVAEKEQSYLYQIVCNQECGIDVDKMDYLRRDAYHTGFPGFQSDYIILNALINQEKHIAFRSKTKSDINDLFNTRTKMHINVYQHHTSKELDKIHFCIMKRLGSRLFLYGSVTDDYNIDTLIRTSPDLSDLVKCIEYRNLHHECENCKEYGLEPNILESGTLSKVLFE